MRIAHIAVLAACGIASMMLPIAYLVGNCRDGFIEIDVREWLSYVSYVIMPVSIYIGMKQGFASKWAMALNTFVLLSLVLYTWWTLSIKYQL